MKKLKYFLTAECFFACFLFPACGLKNEGDRCFETSFKSYGICKRSKDCYTADMVYLNYNRRFDVCGYEYGETILCCLENIGQTHHDVDAFQAHDTTGTNSQESDGKTRNRSTSDAEKSEGLSEGARCYSQNLKRYGICKRTGDCSELYPAHTDQNIQSDLCSYGSDHTVVCCVEPHETIYTSNGNYQSYTTTTTRRPTPYSEEATESSTGVRIAEKKCKEYMEATTKTIGVIPLVVDPEVITFKKPICDYASNPLIVGGTEAEVGEFPHMAAVGWTRSGEPGYVWLCGGSLISDRFVLTAGHCTYQRGDVQADSGPPAVVRLGDHDLRDGVRDSAEPITVKIEEVITHPGYKSPSKYDDIALLKLARAVNYNEYVFPACLYTRWDFQEENVVATGWGTTSNKADDTSNVLRKVPLKVFRNEECQKHMPYNRNWKNGFSKDQMCAGDDAGGKDTCQGDSGGPIQVESKRNHCIFYIVGVTGFGGDCGNPRGSGVYAIVSHYLDWIEKEVWIKNN